MELDGRSNEFGAYTYPRLIARAIAADKVYTGHLRFVAEIGVLTFVDVNINTVPGTRTSELGLEPTCFLKYASGNRR